MVRSLGVVGAGVVGSAIAWRAAESGWSVTLFDPEPGRGASWVAGGMLAPLSEGWPGEDAVLEFGAAALARWPDFAARLRAATGVDVFAAQATLTVALDQADAADLRTIAEWVAKQGYDLDVLDRAAIRALEPALAHTVRLGLLAPTEMAADNRRVVAALQDAVRLAGVRVVPEAVADLDALAFDQVVLAAGEASASLWPGLPIRPVKGEILRLRARPGVVPRPERVVRGRVHGRPVYLVPRADGLVVGATQYEHGHDLDVTVAGVRDLIADAEALMPGIGEYALAESIAGLRPMSVDNLPLIGRLSDRVVVAAGHGRNGILTTPLTAEAVVEILDGGSHVFETASPQRFAGVCR